MLEALTFQDFNKGEGGAVDHGGLKSKRDEVSDLPLLILHFQRSRASPPILPKAFFFPSWLTAAFIFHV